MAEKYNLKCPKCGEKLWYSQSEKVFKCVNPNCDRFNPSTKAERVAADAKKEAESISESSI